YRRPLCCRRTGTPSTIEQSGAHFHRDSSLGAGATGPASVAGLGPCGARSSGEAELLGYGAIRGIDGAVHVRVGRGIRVRDRDAPDARPPGHVRAFVTPPVWRIRVVVVLVGVAVRPAVH